MRKPLSISVLALLWAAPALAGPFDTPSTLPYQAPRFDIIKDGDYQPAFEAGMRQQLAEIAAIAAATAAPSFDNTIVAMERSGRMLERVNNAFFGVVQANTNPALDKVQTAEAPKLAAHTDAIYLNPKLFARVKALYDRRTALKLDAEALQVLTLYYRQFIHAGANLPPKDKARLQQINKRDASLEAEFQQKLVAGAKAGALVVEDKAQLAGLSDAEIANAAQAAKARGLNGKYVIPLQNTTQQPLLTSLADRGVREQLFRNSWTRTEKGDANDTRAIISELASLRAEKAKLLGYPNYAAYVLYDQMAATPQAVEKFIAQLVPATRAKAAEEAKLIQAAIDKDGAHFELKPWDWQRYAEKVRKQRYDLDEEALKPYFELHKVLQDGVFYAANRLYGITFKPRKDIPVYHPDVMVFEVFDHDGSSLGLMYFDYFKRDNKSGGAWMSNFVGQSKLLGTKPVIYNVANFTKPAPGQPALISFDDASTMFHEFGHALHGLFASQTYPLGVGHQCGARLCRISLPVQRALGAVSRSAQALCGEHQNRRAHPAGAGGQDQAVGELGPGLCPGRIVGGVATGHAVAHVAAGRSQQDVDAFEAKALKNTGTDFANVPTRYRSSYFLHIWANGYASGYYAYQWTVMLDDDAYAWFTAHGGLTRAKRPALPRPDPVAGPHHGLWPDVPGLLRQGPRHRPDAGASRPGTSQIAVQRTSLRRCALWPRR